MVRLMVRIARRCVAMIAVLFAAMLAGGGILTLPSASASTSASASDSVVTIWFSGGGTGIQLCDDPGTFFYTGAVVEIDNPCGGRVWVHYVAGTAVQPYCVNPGGGFSYDLPITWKGGDSTNIQVTTVADQCDDAPGNQFYLATLDCGCTPLPMLYGCVMNYPPIYEAGYWVYELQDVYCNFRIWLHQGDGTGNSYCIDPNVDHVQLGPYSKDQWEQVQTTFNQAPCSAGGPPYTP
jgi:hypothetical protein